MPWFKIGDRDALALLSALSIGVREPQLQYRV